MPWNSSEYQPTPSLFPMFNGLNKLFSPLNDRTESAKSADLEHLTQQIKVLQKTHADNTKALNEAKVESKKRKLALMQSMPTSKRAVKKQAAMSLPEYYDLLHAMEQDTNYPFYQESIVKRMKQRAELPLRIKSMKRQLEALENDLAELKTVEESDVWAMDKVYKPMIFHYGNHYYRDVPFVSSITATTSTPPPSHRLPHEYRSSSPSSDSSI